jgi:PAS domain S-box-containing protein
VLNWSIEHKLPLFVMALLVAVVLVLLSIGHREVRRAARELANERLQRATTELASLFDRSTTQQRAQIGGLGKDSAVAAFALSGGRAGRHQARAALERVTRDTASNAALEVWDSAGRVLLRVGRFGLSERPLERAAPDSAFIGPFLQRDTTLYYQVVAPIQRGGRVAGYVQQMVRLNLNAQARATLTGLAGGNVLILLGNAGGDPWTDLAGIIPAPPDTVLRSPIARYQRDGVWRRGGAASIRGTPWRVIAEVPSSVVTAPADAYRRRMIPLAALVVLLGALGAWLGSRRLTGPLREITTTAEAIAGGDLERRARVTREDELGRLARSFNTMAGQLGRSLQHSEAMLRRVTETAHDAIIAADADGIIRYWNPGAERMFGYTTAEVLGKPLTVLMPERFQGPHETGIRRFIETGDARVVGRTVELAGRRKDGSEFPLELSLGAEPLDGKMAFTGIIRDITARKRTQEALQTTNAELESFSYSVSHDLRAPLRAIHGFARILLEDHAATLDPEAHRLLGVIDQNTRRMGQLIDDLLAFSRLGRQELEKRPVDMTELVSGIADDVRRGDGNGGIEFKIVPLPPAQGDRALLRQVWGNLVQNAAKFSRQREHPHIEVGFRPDGNQTVYYVRDNGAGFDDRYADKLFGVFQRLHREDEFEGTGVGLAIVKRIVQRHAGRVWAESKLNEGATFYFTLPQVGREKA